MEKDDKFGVFDERELRLIGNCRAYVKNDPAGLPGHNLMVIISKLADIAGVRTVTDQHGGEFDFWTDERQ